MTKKKDKHKHSIVSILNGLGQEKLRKHKKPDKKERDKSKLLAKKDQLKSQEAADEHEKDKNKPKRIKKKQWIFGYGDYVLAKSNIKPEPKEIKGRVIGVWFNFLTSENCYMVKLKGYPNNNYKYSSALYPEKDLVLYES